MKPFRRDAVTPFSILRIVVAVAVAAFGILKIFDVDVPRWVAVVVLGAGFVVMIRNLYVDYRRKRPRQRAHDGMMVGLVLTLVFTIMLAAIVADHDEDWQDGAIVLSSLILLMAVGGVWSLLRWRRLRAEAEVRLWQLREKRRKRVVRL